MLRIRKISSTSLCVTEATRNLPFDEHELILQMITDHNEDGAEQAMRDHIFSSLSTAIEHIKGIEEKLEA